MPAPSRRVAAALAPVLALGLIAGLVTVPAHRPAAAATVSVVPATSDFATGAFSDPWDFANADDLLVDRGPTSGISGPAFSGGTLSFTVGGAAFVSPLWQGFPSSLHLGRDGASASNMLRADYFTRVHLHAYASTATTGQFVWFNCSTAVSTCEGAMNMGLPAGWNEIDLPIANNPRLLSTGKAWTGLIQGVRLAFIPRASTKIVLDDLRVYHPMATSTITWSSPTGSSAQLWAWDSTAFTPTASQHGGPVPGATSANSGDQRTTDVGGFASATTFYARSGDTYTQVGRIDDRPVPIVDQPTATGCVDYATHRLGRPWTFTSTRSLAGWGNATNLSFSAGGVLNATNSAPHPNDPYILLPVGSGGIDGRTVAYHRLTVTSSYDGPFNLSGSPGGGTMGRIMWRSSGHSVFAMTNDIITYTGKRSVTLDLASAGIVEPQAPAAQRYAFASSGPVVAFRWDPNEDPGARRWHVYSIKLAADCTASSSFPVIWHDIRFVQGSTATVLAINANRVETRLATVTEVAGRNTLTVSTAKLPAGVYAIRVDVTTPSGALGRSRVGSPLVVRH